VNGFDKQELQTIASAFDKNTMTVKTAKARAFGYLGIDVKARTKNGFLKELYEKLQLKKNPAPKRKTSARTQSAAESYVRRKSQATGKSPTKRLVNRRIKNLQAPEGVFPNPSVRNKKFIFVKKAFVNSPNRFSCVAYFHDTPEGNKNAIEYAKAYHRQNPEFIIKVETGTM